MNTWSIPKLTGLRADVKTAINNSNAPAREKDWLCALVDAQRESVSAVRLDVHCHTEKGKTVLSLALAEVF
jgi:hypothetical protein